MHESHAVMVDAVVGYACVHVFVCMGTYAFFCVLHITRRRP